MKTFLVCYEIREINDKSFDDFHNYLKNVSSKYFHVLNSATLIQTDTEIDEIQKTLYEIATRPGNKMFYFVLEIPTERSKVLLTVKQNLSQSSTFLNFFDKYIVC